MKRRLVLGVVGIGLVVVGVATSGYSWLNQPVTSTNIQRNTAQDTEPALSHLILDTPVFTSQVDDMNTRQLPAGASNSLARVAADSKRPMDGDYMAISVQTLPKLGVRDIADITMRRLKVDTYSEVTLNGAPPGSIAFRSVSGYEVSVFLFKDDMYASVVLTGRPDRATQIEQHMSELLTHWQWR